MIVIYKYLLHKILIVIHFELQEQVHCKECSWCQNDGWSREKVAWVSPIGRLVRYKLSNRLVRYTLNDEWSREREAWVSPANDCRARGQTAGSWQSTVRLVRYAPLLSDSHKKVWQSYIQIILQTVYSQCFQVKKTRAARERVNCRLQASFFPS